jgi:hypothetical protein
MSYHYSDMSGDCVIPREMWETWRTTSLPKILGLSVSHVNIGEEPRIYRFDEDEEIVIAGFYCIENKDGNVRVRHVRFSSSDKNDACKMVKKANEWLLLEDTSYNAPIVSGVKCGLNGK